MFAVLCTVFSILVVFGLWVILYDTHRFVVVKHTFKSVKIKKATRLVMMSDLHNYQYGKDNEQLLGAIYEASPDVIVICGDMITANKNDKIDKTLDFLKKLKEKYPIYYAYGNHEQKISIHKKRFGDMKEQFEKGLSDIGIRPIRNAHVSLPDRGIVIYGLEIDYDYFQRFSMRSMPGGYLEKCIGKRDKSSYGILLAHNPEYFQEYASWGAELVLSGHVHGGIIRVPFLGGFISPAIRFFPKYDGGLFEEADSNMVIGRGIGTHTPRVRVFNPAELLVIDLAPAGCTEEDFTCIDRKKQVK